MKKPKPVAPDVLMAGPRGQLQSFYRRAMNLEDEFDALKEDRGELYKEVKGLGYDPKVLRKVVKRARTDRAILDEEQAILELYESAIQADLFAGDDGKVTIKLGDNPPIETSLGVMAAAAAQLDGKKGRKPAKADA